MQRRARSRSTGKSGAAWEVAVARVGDEGSRRGPGGCMGTGRGTAGTR